MSAFTISPTIGATFSFNDFATGVEAIARFGVPTSYSPGVSASATATHPVTGESLSITAYGDISLIGQQVYYTNITQIDFFIGGVQQGTITGPGLTGATLADVYQQVVAMDWTYIGTDAVDEASSVVVTPWGPAAFEPLGDNFIKLAGGNDSFYAGSGEDTLFGGSGDDTLLGGADQDMLYGGEGADNVVGGTGADVLFGGAGNDSVQAGNDGSISDDIVGVNAAWGGTGSDTVVGDGTHDMLGGGSGDDLIYGMDGNDTIYGGGNNSSVDGSSNDSVWGGSGNDVVYGGTHDDMIEGEAGNDTLFGGSANDHLSGGEGADELWGGEGDDNLIGGLGSDSFGFTAGSGNDLIVDFNSAEGDLIDLQGQAFSHSVGGSGNVVLALSGGGSLTLEGVTSFDAGFLL